MMAIRKTVFTLNIGNYAPEITALTYPLLHYYAERIGAEFRIIKARMFPGWPVQYEKLQIYNWPVRWRTIGTSTSIPTPSSIPNSST